MNLQETAEARARLALRKDGLFRKNEAVLTGDIDMLRILLRRKYDNQVISGTTANLPQEQHTKDAIQAQASFCCANFEPQ